MDIRMGQKQDAVIFARLHKQEISQGFLSTLPTAFLQQLYEAILTFPGGVVVAACEGTKVIGFVAGVSSASDFYRYFFRNYMISGFFVLLKRLGNIGTIRRIIEVLLYPKKEHHVSEAELLTIAVAHEHQGKGVAGKMLPVFVEGMKQQHITTFKVLVGEELAHAIRFYEKSGFQFLRNTSVHGNKVSRVYIYDIH